MALQYTKFHTPNGEITVSFGAVRKRTAQSKLALHINHPINDEGISRDLSDLIAARLEQRFDSLNIKGGSNLEEMAYIFTPVAPPPDAGKKMAGTVKAVLRDINNLTSFGYSLERAIETVSEQVLDDPSYDPFTDDPNQKPKHSGTAYPLPLPNENLTLFLDKETPTVSYSGAGANEHNIRLINDLLAEALEGAYRERPAVMRGMSPGNGVQVFRFSYPAKQPENKEPVHGMRNIMGRVLGNLEMQVRNGNSLAEAAAIVQGFIAEGLYQAPSAECNVASLSANRNFNRKKLEDALNTLCERNPVLAVGMDEKHRRDIIDIVVGFNSQKGMVALYNALTEDLETRLPQLNLTHRTLLAAFLADEAEQQWNQGKGR